LTQKEIKQRLAAVPSFAPKIKTGYLGRYAELVSSADKGAVFPR
jgi:dihydroxyacid dehydratase/phosphogluconate dehydratase